MARLRRPTQMCRWSRRSCAATKGRWSGRLSRVREEALPAAHARGHAPAAQAPADNADPLRGRALEPMVRATVRGQCTPLLTLPYVAALLYPSEEKREVVPGRGGTGSAARRPGVRRVDRSFAPPADRSAADDAGAEVALPTHRSAVARCVGSRSVSCVVVKLGSSIVADERGAVRDDVLARICDELAQLHHGGAVT